LYWRGFNIPSSDFVFHRGTLSTGVSDMVQGVDAMFSADITHNGVAWVRAKLPQSEVQSIDPLTDSVDGLWMLAETLKVNDYNASGTVTDYSYSTNAARIVADLMIKQSGLPTSMIDWGAWVDWRNARDVAVLQDYTTIPNFSGFGLYVEYFNGVNFDTLHSSRIDPTVNFQTTSGVPSVGLNNAFSARFEGKIKARHTETYTFYLYHDDGAKLWIDGNLIIDQFTTNNAGNHTATASLTAGTFHDIKIEWKNDAGANGIVLEWSSTSQVREIIPSEVLYPKAQTKKLYETHCEFTNPTRLDDAINKVMFLSNSFYQRVNGKYRFFGYEQVTPSFHFTETSNFNPDTFKKTERELRRQNVFKATFQDLDSQYLTPIPSPIVIERTNLSDVHGKIGGAVENFETMNRYQAYHLLEQIVKRRCDPKYEYSFTGNARSYKVQKNDCVTMDVEALNQTNKQFYVTTARDKSSERTADDREFILREKM
jgi:hypothetical protein